VVSTGFFKIAFHLLKIQKSDLAYIPQYIPELEYIPQYMPELENRPQYIPQFIEYIPYLTQVRIKIVLYLNYISLKSYFVTSKPQKPDTIYTSIN
jgi:hypothetical protein